MQRSLSPPWNFLLRTGFLAPTRKLRQARGRREAPHRIGGSHARNPLQPPLRCRAEAGGVAARRRTRLGGVPIRRDADRGLGRCGYGKREWNHLLRVPPQGHPVQGWHLQAHLRDRIQVDLVELSWTTGCARREGCNRVRRPSRSAGTHLYPRGDRDPRLGSQHDLRHEPLGRQLRIQRTEQCRLRRQGRLGTELRRQQPDRVRRGDRCMDQDADRLSLRRHARFRRPERVGGRHPRQLRERGRRRYRGSGPVALGR